MMLTGVAKALNLAATRLGMAASVQAKSMAMAVVVSPIQLAYELGQFILRLNKSETVGIDDGANVLNQLFIRFFKTKIDNAGVAEHIALQFAKTLRDQAGLTDDQIMTLFKVFADQGNVAEHKTVAFAKNLVDSITATDDFDGTASILDDEHMDFVKQRTDASLVQDLFYRVVQFVRQFEDLAAFADAHAADVQKPLTDGCGITEFSTRATGKALLDEGAVADFAPIFDIGKGLNETPAAREVLAKDFTKAPFADGSGAHDLPSLRPGLIKQDSASITDTGSLISQGYCDLSYFADDYVGAIRTF